MPTEAQRQCRKKNVSFPETFRFHYVFGDEKIDLPQFNIFEIGGKWLHLGPELFWTQLYDCNGVPFGYLLGVAADHDGNDPVNVIVERIDSEDPSAFDALEDYLKFVSGRYAFIVNIAGRLRAYFDPVGMIGAVYNPKTRRLASSPLLTIDREIQPHPEYDHEKIKAGKGGYGLSHTADAEVFRVNGNHYFDLNDFTHQRFWPKLSDHFTAEESEYGNIYDEIISASRNVITSMANRYISVLPLSGGNDSRLLFALAGEEGRSEIVSAFTHINNFANRRDAAVAALICSLKNMPFHIHDRKLWVSDRYDRKKAIRQYHIGSGTNSPVPLEIENGNYQQLLTNSVVMRGHQTNIMRGQYINHRDPESSASDDWVLRMLRLAMKDGDEEATPQYFIDELNAFRRDLPASTKPVEADFLFYEILVPAALAPLFQGSCNAFFMSPFNSRRLAQLSMQFSMEHKLSNNATRDIIMRAESDLVTLPAANSLPARFVEDDEHVEARQISIDKTRERYERFFGEAAPEIQAVAFDPMPYENLIKKMRDEFAQSKQADETTKAD